MPSPRPPAVRELPPGDEWVIEGLASVTLPSISDEARVRIRAVVVETAARDRER